MRRQCSNHTLLFALSSAIFLTGLSAGYSYLGRSQALFRNALVSPFLQIVQPRHSLTLLNVTAPETDTVGCATIEEAASNASTVHIVYATCGRGNSEAFFTSATSLLLMAHNEDYVIHLHVISNGAVQPANMTFWQPRWAIDQMSDVDSLPVAINVCIYCNILQS